MHLRGQHCFPIYGSAAHLQPGQHRGKEPRICLPTNSSFRRCFDVRGIGDQSLGTYSDFSRDN